MLWTEKDIGHKKYYDYPQSMQNNIKWFDLQKKGVWYIPTWRKPWNLCRKKENVEIEGHSPEIYVFKMSGLKPLFSYHFIHYEDFMATPLNITLKEIANTVNHWNNVLIADNHKNHQKQQANMDWLSVFLLISQLQYLLSSDDRPMNPYG